MKKNLFLLVILLINLGAIAQNETTDRKDAINIYLMGDIEDLEYLKQQITFVNYVRDSKDADVIALFTSRNAGNGGEEFSLIFEGSKKFKSKNDTITFFTNADATDDEIRQFQIKYLKIGLVQYVIHSPLIKDVDIDFTQDLAPVIPEDKWNSWVFELRSSMFTNGESSYKNTNINSSASANRITENWKIELDASHNYNSSVYIFPDDTINSSRKSYGFYSLVARSLGQHWSLGEKSSFGNSSYNNKKIYASFQPTIEYNIFPYSKSNVIQWRFQYSIGPNYYLYNDTTIFNKIEELVYSQDLGSAFEISKKWGSISLSAEYSSYLHDFSKYSVGTGVHFSVRLFAGFSVYASGNYTIIHNQLYLPKGDLSYEEILLRQQSIATSYSYYLSMGLSYTFGSIYNNVVNPRFDHI